jgi:hypothetical protein
MIDSSPWMGYFSAMMSMSRAGSSGEWEPVGSAACACLCENFEILVTMNDSKQQNSHFLRTTGRIINHTRAENVWWVPVLLSPVPPPLPTDCFSALFSSAERLWPHVSHIIMRSTARVVDGALSLSFPNSNILAMQNDTNDGGGTMERCRLRGLWLERALRVAMRTLCRNTQHAALC